MRDRTDSTLESAAAPVKHAAAPDVSAMSTVLSAREAAVELGVSERTVRRAIQRGEIAATKRAGSFQITPSALEHYRQRETGQHTLSRAATSDSHAAAQDTKAKRAAAPDAGHVAGDASVVLRELLAEERRKSDALLEASLIWQTRAMQLEQRLKELEAGPITSEPKVDVASMLQDANSAPLRGDRAEVAPDPMPHASDSLALVWRRWWRRMRGDAS